MIDTAELKSLRRELTAGSPRAVRRLLELFDAQLPTLGKKERSEQTESKAPIDNSTYFRVVEMFFEDLPTALGKLHLGEGRRENRKSNSLQKSCVRRLIDFLNGSPGESFLMHALCQISAWVPFFSGLPVHRKKVSSILIKLWSCESDQLRIAAFLAIRAVLSRFAKHLDYVLKAAYVCFVKSCKAVNEHNLSTINFMISSLVELYKVDPARSYAHGFGFIRQLAILLRQAIKEHTPEAARKVCCWQYLSCLKFWTRLLAVHCCAGDSPLRLLVYPLAQLLVGCMSFQVVPQYFAYHLHLARAAIELSKAARVYTPMFQQLSTMLSVATTTRSIADKSPVKPFDFFTIYKVPRALAHSRFYLDSLIEEIMVVLMEACESACVSASFPELTVPLVVRLRRLSKGSKNPKVPKQALLLAQKLEEQAEWVIAERSALRCTPRDFGVANPIEEKRDRAPLTSYYEHYRKILQQRRALVANKPTSLASRVPQREAETRKPEAECLSDVDGSAVEPQKPKAPRKAKKSKSGPPRLPVTTGGAEEEDIVEDFFLD